MGLERNEEADMAAKKALKRDVDVRVQIHKQEKHKYVAERIEKRKEASLLCYTKQCKERTLLFREREREGSYLL